MSLNGNVFLYIIFNLKLKRNELLLLQYCLFGGQTALKQISVEIFLNDHWRKYQELQYYFEIYSTKQFTCLIYKKFLTNPLICDYLSIFLP